MISVDLFDVTSMWTLALPSLVLVMGNTSSSLWRIRSDWLSSMTDATLIRLECQQQLQWLEVYCWLFVMLFFPTKGGGYYLCNLLSVLRS